MKMRSPKLSFLPLALVLLSTSVTRGEAPMALLAFEVFPIQRKIGELISSIESSTDSREIEDRFSGTLEKVDELRREYRSLPDVSDLSEKVGLNLVWARLYSKFGAPKEAVDSLCESMGWLQLMRYGVSREPDVKELGLWYDFIRKQLNDGIPTSPGPDQVEYYSKLQYFYSSETRASVYLMFGHGANSESLRFSLFLRAFGRLHVAELQLDQVRKMAGLSLIGLTLPPAPVLVPTPEVTRSEPSPTPKKDRGVARPVKLERRQN
jgi:hypothetical protein